MTYKGGGVRAVCVTRAGVRRASDPCLPAIGLLILAPSTLATADLPVVVHEFDPADVFDHREAQLRLHPKAKRRAVGHGQWTAVHLVGGVMRMGCSTNPSTSSTKLANCSAAIVAYGASAGGDDPGEPRESHDETERAVHLVDVAEHDQPHRADLAVRDHHREVHDEERENAQRQRK